MIEIGDNLNKKMVAFITDMNQPLGNAVGNALEIIQSIEILKNNGPSDITKLVRYQAAQMILLGKKADSFDEALKLADEMITSGKALEVYKKMVAAQNGDISVFDDYSKFPQASEIIKIKSNEEGFISEIDAMGVGISSLMLGGGRENKDSIIDYAVGIVLRKKVGDFVKKGECLAEFYVNDKAKFETSKLKFLNSYKFSSEKPVIPPLIYSIITIDDTKKINIER
jgi:pyrimidine-nucleoside phosphorylase